MKRLGKQRVEVLQLLNSLRGSGEYKGWKNHPAREMWRGYENALVYYGLCICEEWIDRGYKDTCFGKIMNHFRKSELSGTFIDFPAWLGQPELHISHKSNLIRKDAKHYRQFWPDVADDIPYVWPASAL